MPYNRVYGIFLPYTIVVVLTPAIGGINFATGLIIEKLEDYGKNL